MLKFPNRLLLGTLDSKNINIDALALFQFLALCSCEILLFETNDDDVVNAMGKAKAILRCQNFQLVRVPHTAKKRCKRERERIMMML